jgi:hypothetical protein
VTPAQIPYKGIITCLYLGILDEVEDSASKARTEVTYRVSTEVASQGVALCSNLRKTAQEVQ